MRVCSRYPEHDLSGLGQSVSVCPHCGSDIEDVKPSEAPPEPAPEPVEDETRKQFPQRDPEPQPVVPSLEEGPTDQNAPALPEPVLICEKNPHHDISNRDADAIMCPHPRCGGALIQLECEKDVRHDVSKRKPDQFSCPVCNGPLVRPVCTFNRTHSMVGRGPGQSVCPIDGHVIERVPYRPPHKPPDIEQPWPIWLWIRQHWQALAAAIGGVALIAVLAVVVIAIWPPEDRCARNVNGALNAATRRLQAGISAADASRLADRELECKFVEPALLLLRRAYEEGDAGAARTLGRLFDPTLGQEVVGHQPPNPTRSVEWYARAMKGGNQASRGDLERLLSWLRDQPESDSPEMQGLIETAQNALGGS